MRTSDSGLRARLGRVAPSVLHVSESNTDSSSHKPTDRRCRAAREGEACDMHVLAVTVSRAQ